MRRNSIVLVILGSILLLVSTFSIQPARADEIYVQEGELISYGYRLVVASVTYEIRDEENPVKLWFRESTFTPPGLYDDMEGMELGSIKSDIIVYPEEGYTENDGSYSAIANQTLYYYDLKIYEVGGVFYTDYINNGGSSTPFGKIFLNILYAILAIGAIGFLGFGIYKYYPKVFGKRCIACKALAIGKCKKCGRTFCESCYSSGCPYCKSRTLLRFKPKS